MKSRPTFSLDPYFDFFVLGEDIFVSHKARFESVLSYRAGHVEVFEELVGEPEFSEIIFRHGRDYRLCRDEQDPPSVGQSLYA